MTPQQQRDYLIAHTRTIPDFPTPGINFRDVTTLFKDPAAIAIMDDMLYELYRDQHITKVVGIESRGFIMGAILARRLGAGLVLCRKPGKLPAATLQQTYTKEYGTDTIEIHADAITPEDNVLIHDDLLATGGTITAATELVQQFHPRSIHLNFLIEIHDGGLCGRHNLPPHIPVTTLLTL